MGSKNYDALKQLRAGEKVICSSCNQGELKPVYTQDVKKAHLFKCTYCNEALMVNVKMPKGEAN